MNSTKFEVKQLQSFNKEVLFPLLLVLVMILFSSVPGFAQVERIRVDSRDDLPVHSYPVQSTMVEVINSPVQMAKLMAAMRRDLVQDLATFEITDAATLKGMYRSLARLDLIEGSYVSALVWLDKVRELEDKRASQLMGGLVARSLIAAKANLPESATASDMQLKFEAELRTRLSNMPWELVQDKVKEARAQTEYLSENLLLGVVRSQIQPAVEASGEVSSDLADGLLKIHYTIEILLPLNPVVAGVYGDYITQNTVEKPNIWPSREVVLDDDKPYSPVVVAIWDAGVDVAVFSEQIFVNNNELPNGRDDDDNGFVDDIHGIAFDLEGAMSTELLLPLGTLDENIENMIGFIQGFWDMTEAIESPAASSTRQKLAMLEQSEVGEFIENLSLYNQYMHGTHVAGIASDGNPFARILVSRLSFDHRQPPRAVTPPIARKFVQIFESSINYFKANGVRVVNMSWGVSLKEIEAGLEANGVGETTQERTRIARNVIDILAEGLRDAISSTPDILYVTAAGNENNDVNFDIIIPSAFELPNLLVVGALDQSGDPTSFTSSGTNVKLYANGYRVESLVPGGRRLKGSGTSMAAPAVSNLAAKIIARNSKLSVQEVINLVEKGADAHPNNPGILRINQAETMNLLTGH